MTLHLNGNAISGSLASSIGLLTNLRSLTLDFNLLQSSIPSELGHLNSLEVFWLSDNLIDGAIPTEIGQLTMLKEVRVKDRRDYVITAHVNGVFCHALTFHRLLLRTIV
jgi:Leucine-rich repeat (LRR) protein